MKTSFTIQFVLISLLMLTAIKGFSVNINVGGAINSNTTWNADTVKVDSTVTVNNGYTLTIAAGTYVQFQGHYSLTVQGRLLAQGTKSNPIEFSALNQNSGWGGIRFHYTPITNDTSKIEYCRLTYGKANVGGFYDKLGGAIYVNGFSKVQIVNNFIANNYASYYGGGIAVRYASPQITGNVIVNNTASSQGGGMYIYAAPDPMIMMNNTIAKNYSYNGGGFYTTNSTTYIYGSIVWGNYASSYPQMSSGVSCGYSTIEGGYSGSHVLMSDPLFVSPTSGFGSNYAASITDYQLQAGSPAIDKGYQHAQNYGVKDFDAYGKFRFDNEKIDQGGLEYISSTEVCGYILTNTTWSGNILVNCNVTVNSGRTLTIQPGTKIIFTGNYYLKNSGRIVAQGTNNQPISFTSWNKNLGWGGIYTYNNSTLNDTSKFEYCNISYGKRSYGGGFYINNSSKILIRNCIIKNNKATYYGGGIYVYNSSPRIISNLIINNEAGNSVAGGIYISGSGSAPKIYNNTIARNKSTSYGAGLYRGTGSPVLKNNIIWRNEDGSGNHTLSDNIYPSTGLSVTYSDIEGGYSGTGNINVDPLFKFATYVAGSSGNTNAVNFALQSSSPCIDAGTTTTAGMSMPLLDINGRARVYNSRIDMGAYEDKTFLNVCGTISSDQIWDASIININCNVTISNGATVTINPGTEVRFNGHYSITVKGAIQALGAKNDTIVFTSVNTSTGWDGVQIDDPNNSNDSIIFNYCKFEYANRTPSSFQLGGGALSIRSYNKIRVTNSNFVHNTNAGSNARGAAIALIYVQSTDPDILISHNSFSYNSGSYGTVAIIFGQFKLKNNEFYKNTNSSGAAIKIYQSGAELIDNMISNNTGDFGGGISIQFTYLAYKVRLINNIIVNNQASRGGGLYINDVQPELYNNTIANNLVTGTLKGGGIYFYSNADAIMKSNIIYGNVSSGAVSNQLCIDDLAADPKIYNCDIEGGRVAFSGTGSGINYNGVFLQNLDVDPTFGGASSGAGTSYSGRAADWSINQGSAVINAGYSNSGSMDLPSTDYAGNTRIFNGRIDIGAYENQEAIVSPCTISSNTVWEADTIKVSCDVTINSGKKLTIRPGTKVLFTGYYSIDVEGAIVAEGTPSRPIKFMVNDTTGFYDYSVSNGAWHGIHFNSVLLTNDSSKFSYCIFTNAKATGSSTSDKKGGAMNIYNSSKIAIENCKFSNNSAAYGGGALYIESSNPKFRNNIICNNYANNYGGGVYLDDVSSEFTNLTIVNNRTNPSSSSYAGGMYITGSAVALKNSIIWGNIDSYSSGSFSQLLYQNSGSSSIYNSDIQYGQNKIGNGGFLAHYQDNVDVDPLFKSPSLGSGIHYDGTTANWKLKSNTSLINKGDPSTQHTSLDIVGNPRVVSDTIDIGAAEVQLSRQFITQQPNSKSVCETNSTSFSVGISIATSYQWMHNGSSIAGANNATYSISNASDSDTGFYYCVMSTNDGSINSDTAELGIQYAPAITNSPTSTSACLGDTASFAVGATGTEPLVYTWQNSLGVLQTSSSSGMKTVGVQTSSNSPTGYPSTFANWYWGNKYQFVVLASELTAAGVTPGNLTSIAFNVLNVNSCPALGNYSIQMGATSNSTLSTTFVNGLTTVYSSPSYQPAAGWNNITFQTPFNWNGTSNIIIQICSNNSSYVSNGNASIALTTTSYNSGVYRHLDQANICSYTTGIITTKRPVIRLKTGSSNLQYYSIDSVMASDASVYKCNVSNMCGSALTTGAQLTVKSAPSVVPIIGSASVCENQSYTYTTSATGTAPITYQWYKDGSSIAGSNSVSHSIASVSSADGGIYYCKASNSCGSDSTNQSVLSVNLVPSITSQASSLDKCENQSAMFSIQASGSPTLTYQWYKGGSAVSGGNNSSLLISPVSTSDAGSYYCKVTNLCGNVSGTPATLTVKSNVSITAQSSSQTLCEGSSPTLSITAAGTAPITYQWYYNNSAIAGKTNNTFALTSIDTSDAGNYYCIATNACTSVNSNAITLNVNQAPNIVTNPQSATVCENYSAVFTVSANGTNPITYQWYDGSGSITGATGASYIIPQASSANAGNYYVKATNACGTTTSSPASLTVNNNVSISSQSNSKTVCSGVSTSFSITASGPSSISYQWYKDGVLIPGATNNTLNLTSVDTSDDASYYVVATGICNSVQSNTMILTVNEAPTILSQPNSSTICSGSAAQLSVSSNGTAPMSYQWYKGGSLITGATNNNYIIGSTSSSDAGVYYVKVSNTCGTVNSQNATLTVNDPVSITAQSSSQSVCEGTSSSLSITASGASPISYQWYKDGTSISGATNNILNLTSVDTSDDASYYIIASNSCNSVQSNTMLLTVNEAPTITNQPTSGAVCSGSGTQLSVSATGTAPISYQWYKGGSTITGATNNNYIIGSTTVSDAGNYYAEITNTCGTLTSQTATLTVNNPVSITAQSGSQSVCESTSPSLSITASGASPISYQWYKDGAAISSATNNLLSFTSVDTSDDASYYVIASNMCNSVQSNTMALTVNESPAITLQPISTTVCSGSGTQLSVSASGTSPMNYQWYKAGNSLIGATNNNLIISSADTSDAATYYVEITNTCGTITSQTATLTVNNPVSITAQSGSQSVCEGTSPSLSITASGASPISYQWYKDGDTISGATNNLLSFTSVDTSDDASYYVIASNMCNSVQSNTMALTVNQSPTITLQPISATACSGSGTQLSISATGTAPMSYQWYKGGTPISGAVSGTYLIGSADTSDAGSYYCKVSNSCSNVTSNTATLTVNNPANITSQSGDSTKCVGSSMIFAVTTSGTAPINYQWYHNGNAITGGTSATYSIASVATSDMGDYYCIVSNTCNTVQSNSKTLTVNTAPAIAQQSGDTSICSGSNLTLSVATTGSAPMAYQWYKGTTPMGGAINSLYPMYQISTTDAGTYYCVASNSCGSAQSTNMIITVKTPPSITYQSADSARCEGESMTFKVNATGTDTLLYQWYQGQTAVSGADSSIYYIPNVAVADNGNYYVEISNSCATITSLPKYLTVHATPQIALGNDTTFCDGGSMIIGPGYGYYCLWNTGQVASQLNITSTGSYSATVTDQYGCNGSTDTININVVLPYANQEICLVTVDSATGKNVIVWEKTPNMGISSFNIYKESNVSGVYSLLANRPYDSLSVVLDLASNPTVSAERYTITVVDSCGNESPFSPAHRTMHLTVNKGQNNDWNLIWNAYEGFTPSSYKIYRADSSMNFVNIATVSGSSSYTYLYTDQNAPANVTVYYYVEVVHPNGGCSASKGTTNYHTSRSNHANSGMTNPSTLLPAFFGTPTSGVFPLDVHFFDQSQGNPTEWEWNFGDGSIDSVQNPTHSYTQIGVYSVSLVVKDATGMNSISFQNYITVLTTGIAEVDENFDVKVFPNPYSNKTNIAYALTKKSSVHIEIFNAVGVKVVDLINQDQMAGSYKFQFRAADYGFSSGVYYLRMNVDGQLYTKKLVEVK